MYKYYVATVRIVPADYRMAVAASGHCKPSYTRCYALSPSQALPTSYIISSRTINAYSNIKRPLRTVIVRFLDNMAITTSTHYENVQQTHVS